MPIDCRGLGVCGTRRYGFGVNRSLKDGRARLSALRKCPTSVLCAQGRRETELPWFFRRARRRGRRLNLDGVEFGEERRLSFISANSGLTPTTLLERLLEHIRGFSAGTTQPDDLTALV